MKFISGINELSDRYSHFIFDVWGVVHDGSAAYPGVVEAISFLRKEGKRICFLSNAPRRADIVSNMLEKFGVTPDLYDFILTSGEVAFLDLAYNQDNNFKKFGKNYFYIGPQKDINLLDGLNYKKVEDAAHADFVVTTGFDHDESVLAEKLPQAAEAKRCNLPMLCINPDMIVVRQSGHQMICAGTLAAEYERMGGEVMYYGKPFSSAYEAVYKKFVSLDSESTSNSFSSKNDILKKYLAIGDGLETDIKGASNFGIDSLLVTGGILSNPLGIKYWQSADEKKLRAICDSYQLFPQFVIPSFKL